MNEVFIKKYWAEDDTLFYLHFKKNKCIRQIEIKQNKSKFLSEENPIQGESMLYDQDFNEKEFDKDDFINKEEFEIAWNNK